MSTFSHRRRLDKLASDVASRTGHRSIDREWLATLTLAEVELGAGVAEHVKRTGTTEGLDANVLRQYDALMDRWQAWNDSQ